MTQRVYIDTSVIGGMFDEEFKFFTGIFFDRVFKNEIRLIISDLLEGELASAPDWVLEFYKSLPPDNWNLLRAQRRATDWPNNISPRQLWEGQALPTASILRLRL